MSEQHWSVSMFRKAVEYWPWVRFNRGGDGRVRDRRWLWTPATYRFGHGGWVFLSLAWLWRFRRGA